MLCQTLPQKPFRNFPDDNVNESCVAGSGFECVIVTKNLFSSYAPVVGGMMMTLKQLRYATCPSRKCQRDC